MEKSKQNLKVAIYLILAIIMLGSIYISYRFLNIWNISLEIYSLTLVIFGGVFFFFLQRAYSIKSEEVIKKLSLVPKINNLVIAAKEKSKDIDNLEIEKKILERIVEFSANKRKKIKNRIELTFFNFNIAYLYAFLAGILISLSLNLFTTIYLTENLPVCVYKVYGMILSLSISSTSAFVVSALLQIARSEWESAGSPKDPVMQREDYIGKGNRITLLWVSFAIFIISFISFIYFYFH